MRDVNSVVLIGRLVRDFDERSMVRFGGGGCVAQFALAVGSSVKKDGEWQDKANFFDCKAFGASAEYLFARSGGKGRQVCVSGELSQETWTDKATGKPRSKIVVLCREVQLLREVGDRQQEMPAAFAKKGGTGSADAADADDGFPEDIPW